ncbi:MAG: DUF4013 domain-containing protein [Methanobacterium sp. ERen5]|nr:MAG: DUF4013 domain-containing protein [Methanobacterium sp. ERen5]
MKDSLSYPLSDRKKLLMLGILCLSSILYNIFYLFGDMRNLPALAALWIMGFVVLLLVNGYGFRIIKSSLNGLNELPNFNQWLEMLKNGAKILIVGIVYLIPIMIFTLIFYEYFFIYTVSGILGGTPLSILAYILEAILTTILHGTLFHVLAVKGFPLLVVLIYYVVIIPIYYVAIANLANNGGKLRTAFNLGEILEKTIKIGFKKISIFYLLIILIIYWCELTNIVYLILATLIVVPYLKIFISRFVGLIYIDTIQKEI